MSIGWFERANETLQKYSVSNEWSKMLLEWEFHGRVFEVDNVNCELCDHHGLMWHFEITNRLNSNKLLVGSECIKNFYHEYNQAHPDMEQVDIDSLDSELKELVREFIEADRKFNIKMVLRSIRINNPKFPIELKKGKFSPNQLKWILSLAERFNIEYDPTDFKLNLKKLKFFQQLTYSDETRLDEMLNYLKYILPSMTKQQVKSLDNLSKNRLKLLEKSSGGLFHDKLN